MIYLKYLRYVLVHKWYVYLECRKLGLGFWQAFSHDWSKFSRAEFPAYAKLFYQDMTDPVIKKNFMTAWRHHISKNPHHWNYWLVDQEMGHDPEEFPAYAMPERYLLEMIADWRGMGRSLKQGDPALWYQANEAKIILHPTTRTQVHHLLGIST